MARQSLFAATTILAVATVCMPLHAGPAEAEDAPRHHMRNDTGQERYRRDGGAVRLPAENRAGGRHEGDRGHVFRANGDAGRINGIDRLTGSASAPDTLQEFNEDNLNTAPDIYSTSEREEFLEDGGSISASTFRVDAAPIVYRGGLRPLRGPAAGHWRHVVVQPTNISDRGSVSFLTSDVGYERGNRGAFRRLSGGSVGAVGGIRASSSAPKIIDVEAARLDRRRMPPSGIDTIWTGGAKIIRIAKDYRRGDDTASLK
ncbi:hypothetical protein [Jiella avicenniae]|uniref:Uncharacterized protein n=1 Tax=Jiella avicenniae TaxID=2907202 RepID=A0A9X1T3Q2_9HYPH|nr:hypothetical protein [Jiella avicenniae]MCE7026500.1 hypothetical protein [Jiella avicenniae]